MSDVLARVVELESSAYRDGRFLARLDAHLENINDKLDDLSGQVREVRLSARELSDRLTANEVNIDGLESKMAENMALLERIAAKLGA